MNARHVVELVVNGCAVKGDADARTSLAEFLRTTLGLTGTHIGCDTSQCGACTVHLDGEAIKSCTLFAVQASGRSVMTIEGVARNHELHPMQKAFQEHHALQCGFCTPGMVMSALALVRHIATPTELDIRRALEGNLCRCTGYYNIVNAIAAGARAMRD
jgi:carbon-monoxide dehydrogenase small subunit